MQFQLNTEPVCQGFWHNMLCSGLFWVQVFWQEGRHIPLGAEWQEAQQADQGADEMPLPGELNPSANINYLSSQLKYKLKVWDVGHIGNRK